MFFSGLVAPTASCVDLQFNGCCNGTSCNSTDGTCSCDQGCYARRDCCSDISGINCFEPGKNTSTPIKQGIKFFFQIFVLSQQHFQVIRACTNVRINQNIRWLFIIKALYCWLLSLLLQGANVTHNQKCWWIFCMWYLTLFRLCHQYVICTCTKLAMITSLQKSEFKNW